MNEMQKVLCLILGLCLVLGAAKPTVPWDDWRGIAANIHRASDELTAQLEETNVQLKRITDSLERKDSNVK